MTRFLVWFLILIALAAEANAQATNVYVTPSGTATGNCPSGTASAPNLTPAQFNTAGNWGIGTGKIGADTRVLLCGTFTSSTPGDILLSFQGGGTSGHPITLLFDTGATVTNSAYWGDTLHGAISDYAAGSHIVIDGGSNGLIQNTGNGSGLAYGANSSGVVVYGVSDVVIKHLTVANIYQHTSYSDTSVYATSGIELYTVTNGTIQNNIVHDASSCVGAFIGTSGAANITLSNNTVSRCNWGVWASVYLTSASNVTITGNDISNAANWDDASDNNHHNGIMVFDTTAPYGLSAVTEANNHIWGDLGLNTTGYIFNDDNAAAMSGFYIYNNALINTSTHPPSICYITGVGSSSFVLNNTIVGNGTSGAGICSSGGLPSPSVTQENNLITSVPSFVAPNSPYTLIDYNQYMNLIASGCAGWHSAGVPCAGESTFAAWKTACSCDPHGAYNVSNTVNANGTLQIGSPAIGAGVNLTSLGITALNSGINGVARPASGAWDIGAYQYVPSVYRVLGSHTLGGGRTVQ